MKYRKAVFVVVYCKIKNKVEYLILKRHLHWKGWEFPKGGVRFYENKKRAIIREVKEETGLKVLELNKFGFSGKYQYDKIYSDRKGFIGQTFGLYSAEVEKGKISIDKKEHSDYKWVSFNEAVRKLKWPNQRKSLKIINNWLKNG